MRRGAAWIKGATYWSSRCDPSGSGKWTIDGTRILTEAEQTAPLKACSKKLAARVVRLALSRMIASGIDDFTVMALSGHRSVRMLERYSHPTNARKIDALKMFAAVFDGQHVGGSEKLDGRKCGGRQEARTPDLRVANATGKRRKDSGGQRLSSCLIGSS